MDLTTLPKPLSTYSFNELPDSVRESKGYKALYENAFAKYRAHRELTADD